ncbi:MAG: hypothetical protein RL038_272 [Actinomycetota bacterium]|jgi:nitrite reductase/ring-hydroxylating ferredoxin subunit
MTNRREFIAASAVFLAACAAPGGATPSLEGEVELGLLSEVPIGAGRVFEAAGLRVLVTRQSESEFRAFEAKCTHQSGALNAVENGEIICPIHGAKFDAATGEVLQGPAERNLVSYTVKLAADNETLVLSN